MHAPSAAAAPDAAEAVAVNLIAVLVALRNDEPCVLTIGGGRALPSGPFALTHRSLQSGLRNWVEQQTHQPIGYVEQLYTFADRDRGGTNAARMVSISYLGLTRVERAAAGDGPAWLDWYDFFPWEDRRNGKQPAGNAVEAALRRWTEAAPDVPTRQARAQRCAVTFGLGPHGWNEEFVLQRYELLFEAKLIPEAWPEGEPPAAETVAMPPGVGMTGDHRRILATGVARLRAKIKYRPVVFELMPPAFTLFGLQRSVEALAGRPLHKGNFRRLIEQQALVEETGATSAATGGRPAKLYRFRGDVLAERAVTGTKLPLAGSQA